MSAVDICLLVAGAAIFLFGMTGMLMNDPTTDIERKDISK